MKIIEYAPYIKGIKKFPKRDHIEVTSEDLLNFSELVQGFSDAKEMLDEMKLASTFFNKYPTIKQMTPSKIQEELFYILKNGKVVTGIPAKFVWVLREAKKIGSVNYVFKLARSEWLEEFFSEGYLGKGLKLEDAFTYVSGEESHVPLEEGRFAIKMGSHYDVYIQSVDAIAMLPAKLVDMLSNTDIENIEVTKHGLSINGKPIASMGDYLGAINSTYDLRGLV
jgi:hypothetical protein